MFIKPNIRIEWKHFKLNLITPFYDSIRKFNANEVNGPFIPSFGVERVVLTMKLIDAIK